MMSLLIIKKSVKPITDKGRETYGKTIGQFCCNNGRELLSLVNCEFVAANIYDIGKEYEEMFDVVIITIGALC